MTAPLYKFLQREDAVSRLAEQIRSRDYWIVPVFPEVLQDALLNRLAKIHAWECYMDNGSETSLYYSVSNKRESEATVKALYAIDMVTSTIEMGGGLHGVITAPKATTPPKRISKHVPEGGSQ